ncbi:MAG: amylosucrase [Hungatella sp.]|nr:amylosucrase [Hungatella sp.]MCI9360317.1 amylosucrase [Hungatella sp.]
MGKNEEIYEKRFARHLDELKWLYMELYDSAEHFEELLGMMKDMYGQRKAALKKLDLEREENPQWFKGNDMLGMMMYTGQFAGNLKGVKKHLDYVKSCGVNYLHLMPLMESPKGRSDGGYAVADFRKVQEELGTVKDLEDLAAQCHKQGISLCLDFVMNHTSEDHAWARRARAGEKEYQDRYFFYDSWDVPGEYEKTVPQVFPTTAPGNFTWLPDTGKWVMTTFYPYQWDLNYRNPLVFHEMMYNFLFMTNLGIDVIRIDAVPYIWKELGTSCRNLKQVHTIVRMMRMIGEIVCPGILLLGEVVMEPEKVAPYFGTVEKPECHMLYNVTTMATIWHTVAVQDTRLLRKQMDIVYGLPKSYTFLNYLRCHDDIGWGLDYDTLESWGMKQVPHKQYLNDFFTGALEESFSRGELYNNDPVTKDARFCGTAASMCGVEKAGFCQDEAGMEQAIRLDRMLHAYMLFQSGIPVIYSGDEIGQVNDYTYKEDPDKAEDSRYIHRGQFKWELVENIEKEGTVQQRMFDGLRKLETLRSCHEAFGSEAQVQTVDFGDNGLLGIVRTGETEKIQGIFNFNWQEKRVFCEHGGQNLLTGEKVEAGEWILIPAYGFVWLKVPVE